MVCFWKGKVNSGQILRKLNANDSFVIFVIYTVYTTVQKSWPLVFSPKTQTKTKTNTAFKPVI